MEPVAQHLEASLRPDLRRVVGQLFLPGEEHLRGRSRIGGIVERVLALPEAEVERLAAELIADFAGRHRNYPAMLTEHASIVRSHIQRPPPLSAARELVMGASFTAEYTVEGAALCNPSAVLHPDQSGLLPGQTRIAVSLRAIGEGHLSSLGFGTALIGPGAVWSFEPRALPAVAGDSTPAQWQREHLRAVLADQGRIDGLAHSVLASLPETFTGPDLQQVLGRTHHDLLARAGGPSTVDLLRRMVDSAYEVSFPADVELSQRVLLPAAAEESSGLEDARFVRFTADDGTVEYRATYTAYDGKQIAPRLLASQDLRTFRAHRLAGPAASNKGMALFPRKVGGRYLALCRTDGENNWLASSADGYIWGEPELLQTPAAPWEIMQLGNCGSPIETDEGWLVLTHGVGPMRTYAIGAILLDLDKPSRVLRRLERPLLQGDPAERDGYVPNVVYSCGGLVHDGRLWLPYGIGDTRIGVAWASVDQLLAEMESVGDAQAVIRR